MSAVEEDFDYPYCDEVSKYEQISKIGQGTFGEVFKAQDKNTRRYVALKKVLMDSEKEGFPITALREIRILQILKNENIVNLIEICRSANSPKGKATFFLVFDFCEHDLAGLLSNPAVHFNMCEIKKVMKQLLEGLHCIHQNKILHRDMKAANILINKRGVLKIADFGLARAFSNPTETNKQNRYTNRVVTLWYRPPELLLGERDYTPAVDIWGAGCIMAEMWTRTPLMQGKSDQDQLRYITMICGAINPDTWPGVEKLPLFEKCREFIDKGQRRVLTCRLKTKVQNADALDLLDRLLTLNPKDRPDAHIALDHDFFWTEPMPGDLGEMLSKHTQSMFEFTAVRRRTTNNHHRTRPANNDHQYRDHIF
ncbi:Cyclin-dependent kinase 9, partial [Fragariocoptes setiger]